MNNLSKIITTFAVCEFINEAVSNNEIILTLQEFSEDCEILGGNRELFVKLATRELEASHLLEQEGGAVAAPPANTVGGGGIAGMKPEDIGVPVEAQKRHVSTNSIFKRKKPNKYYMDQEKF